MPRSELIHAAISERLGPLPGVAEKPMFGGVGFMLDGNMVCGAMKTGGMFRVGKARETEALTMEGVVAEMPSGRRMGGFVRMPNEAAEEFPETLAQLIDMALTFTATLPPKG